MHKGGKQVRIGRWLVLTGILLIVSQGCATHSKPPGLQEMQSITSLRVVRYESARLQIKTSASQAVAFTGTMFGAIGGAFGGAISSTMESSKGKALADKCELPDFSQLVQAGFVE